MLTAAQFYEASKRAGLTRVLTWTPSVGLPGAGVEQAVDVIWKAPGRDVLGGEAISTDYTAEYPAGLLPGIKRGEVVAVDSQQYTVREGPRNKDLPADGTVMEIKLRKGAS